MQELVDKMSLFANKTALELMKRSENRQKAYIVKRLNDPEIAERILP